MDKHAKLITIRDPMTVVVGDTYYLTGTQPPYWRGVNDGVHLWSTKDLKSYTYYGIILSRNDIPEEARGRDRFRAPEIFDGEDGRYYLTFHDFEAKSLEELVEDCQPERMYIREVIYNPDGTIEIKYYIKNTKQSADDLSYMESRLSALF